MAQFDVYANKNQNTQQTIPYLLDIQADILDGLATRVIVPLYAKGKIKNQLKYLNPTVSIHDEEYVLSIAELSAVPVAYLGQADTNLKSSRHEIIAAIDLLITGI